MTYPSYIILYLLIVLGIRSGFFAQVIPGLIFKFPRLTKPLVCSTCATFWITLIIFLCGALPTAWLLLAPFAAPLVELFTNLLFDSITKFVECFYKLFRL